MDKRDIVVIGGSAGGLAALERVLAGVPRDLPAAMLVVLHRDPVRESSLPAVLARRGPWPASAAVHGDRVEHGHILVAPSDNHLIVRRGYVHVIRGPRENGHRPAVDALFRSAAAAYGPRVVAVLLSGFGDCGTAGLMSVKARGGLAIVQDPADAEVPEMPRNARAHVPLDAVLPAASVGPLLAARCREPAGPSPPNRPRGLAVVEGDEPGLGADMVCPSCGGRMTEGHLGGHDVFRCHVGHAFSLPALASEQAEAQERALWAAVRTLEESAALSRRSAARASAKLGPRLAEKAAIQARNAEIIREMLLGHGLLVAADGEALGDDATGEG
jgi:two-component system chemotaxis response regulator CheB